MWVAKLVSGWVQGVLAAVTVIRVCSDSGNGWTRTAARTASSLASPLSSRANLTSKFVRSSTDAVMFDFSVLGRSNIYVFFNR